MQVVHITSSNPKFNGSHFGLPPSCIHKMTGWVANSRVLWRMRTAPIFIELWFGAAFILVSSSSYVAYILMGCFLNSPFLSPSISLPLPFLSVSLSPPPPPRPSLSSLLISSYCWQSLIPTMASWLRSPISTKRKDPNSSKWPNNGPPSMPFLPLWRQAKRTRIQAEVQKDQRRKRLSSKRRGLVGEHFLTHQV